MPRRGLSRRRLLRLAAALPFGALAAACGGSREPPSTEQSSNLSEDEGPLQDIVPRGDAAAAVEVAPVTPVPSPTVPPPFIVASGEVQRQLMPGTPYETPLHVFGTGRLGPIVAVLGGVHGNEPGGWMAAERIAQEVRPSTGALLVLPHANKQAMALFERTTDELGDLNRLYPGDRGGQPMAQMAFEIVEILRHYHVSLVIDMHESWSFYSDRTETQGGTAFLGQTISSRGEPGESLAKDLVEAMNSARVQAPHEEFHFRVWPPRDRDIIDDDDDGDRQGEASPDNGDGRRRGSRSSLGLPNHIPGISSILVEMGQQQPLDRRIQMHVDVVTEALSRVEA